MVFLSDRSLYKIYHILNSFKNNFEESLKKSQKNNPEKLKKAHEAFAKNEVLKSLSDKEKQYVKTVKVLQGDVLYSDSWLDT